jgi:hypothetical protein
MRRFGFELILALVLAALWLALWRWQNPDAESERIKSQEVALYLQAAGKIPFPPDERAGMLAAAKAWMESDDGKPFYMLNLMRFHPQLRSFPGSIDFKGTPQQSNERYEDAAIPMLLKRGGYPTYAGAAQGKNILEQRPELDDWGRVLLVRYPSRRAFMELVTDPAYQAVAPYKLMALSVVLTPTAPEIVMPELPWLAGIIFVVAWLALGWIRAARRTPPMRPRA